MNFDRVSQCRNVSGLMMILATMFFVALMPCLADEAKNETLQWTPLLGGNTLEGWGVPKLEGEKKAEFKDGCIVLGRDDLATGIKYEKPFPKSNYEIMYEARRVKGYDFFGTITFPVQESHCSFVTGGWGGYVIGLSSINGYDASENETSSYYEFKDRQWYRFRLCVSDDRIMVWVNLVENNDDKKNDEARDDKNDSEKPKINFVIGDKVLTTRLEVTPYQPLGFNTWNTEGHIRDIKFRRLSSEEIERIKKF